VASAEGVSTAQGNNLLIVETHAVENIPEVLGSARIGTLI
jgi:hypothetical protein